MGERMSARDCHDQGDLGDRQMSTSAAAPCDSPSAIWGGCCVAPISQEAGQISSTAPSPTAEMTVTRLSGRVEPRPPSPPPDDVLSSIASQRHALGSFILFSSYLL